MCLILQTAAVGSSYSVVMVIWVKNEIGEVEVRDHNEAEETWMR